MKRSVSLAFVALMASMLVACGSDSPTAPQGLSPNISGSWSGQATVFGGPTNVTAAINQPISDPGLTAVQNLTGVLTLGNGTPVAMTGTKQGNSWSVSGNVGATIVTIHQVLTSATASAGDLTLQFGAPTEKATVVLNLQKS